MDRYDGVDLGTNMDELVVKQLKTGMYRDRYDSAPGDWLVRAWENISPIGRRRLSEAIHRALLNKSLEVRLGALRTLDGHSAMVIPDVILKIASDHLHLFLGLRREEDPLDFDQGKDLVRIASAVVQGKEGDEFRHKMVKEPELGNSVLVSLARREPAWVLKHLPEIVNSRIDPKGKRVRILIAGLKEFPDDLHKAVVLLAKQEPVFNPHLIQAIEREIQDAGLKASLLDSVSCKGSKGRPLENEG